MPRWETHLEIAERLNETLKFTDKDREAFLLGSILPDINSGYLLPEVSKIIDKDYTHFYWDDELSYQKFAKKYSTQIANRDPLFLGYLAHLYTDYFWNDDFSKRASGTEIAEKDHEYQRILKQGDFWVYNNRFKRKNPKINYPKYLTKRAQEIEEIALTEEDISRVLEYLSSGDLNEDGLKFYQPEQLDELLENTIIKITTKLNQRKD